MPKMIPIQKATNPELVAYGERVLGRNDLGGMKRPDLISIITQAGHAQVEVADAPEPTAQEQAAAEGRVVERPVRVARALAAKADKDEPMVTIFISNTPGQGERGQRPVEVGVNGTMILIPRQKNVQVAYRYYEALMNARQEDYQQTFDERGMPKQLLATDAPSYPVSLIHVDQNAVAEWKRKKRIAQENAAEAKLKRMHANRDRAEGRRSAA